MSAPSMCSSDGPSRAHSLFCKACGGTVAEDFERKGVYFHVQTPGCTLIEVDPSLIKWLASCPSCAKPRWTTWKGWLAHADKNSSCKTTIVNHQEPIAPRGIGELVASRKLDWRSPISIAELEKYRERLFRESGELLRKKGNDYNSTQQMKGDTLFNLRVCEIMGIVDTPVDGLLVRMSDKFQRLVSLTRQGAQQQVSDESLEDTLKDFWNYGTYALAMLRRAKGEKIE